MSETEAISLAQLGDSDALGSLFSLHRQTVFRRCRQILKDPDEAEDVTQDVFLLLCQKIGQFKHRSSFSTWLFHLTTNKALDHIRYQKNRPAADGGDIPEALVQPDQHVRLELEEILATLKPKDRDLLEARDAGYKLRELGTSKASVRRRLQRVRSVLREARV